MSLTRWLQRTVVVLVFAIVACKEVRQSNVPLTRQVAMERAGIKMPLPASATNVKFHLAGETQNWNLHLYFEAPLSDIEAAVKDEMELSRRLSSLGEKQIAELLDRVTIPGEKPPPILEGWTPEWWNPSTIKSGYYVGLLRPNGRGPRFWIDIENQRVWFFDRF